MTPLGPLRRTARPDVALRQRGWAMEYPAWWRHPTLTPDGRVTMFEAWARTVASEAKAAALPRRVQRTRAKGGGMPAGAKYVGRPTKWGNPYAVAEWGLPLALALYSETLHGCWNPQLVADMPDDQAMRAYRLHHAWLERFHGSHPLEVARSELAGLDLACWCREGEPCHADALLSAAADGGQP